MRKRRRRRERIHTEKQRNGGEWSGVRPAAPRASDVNRSVHIQTIRSHGLYMRRPADIAQRVARLFSVLLRCSVSRCVTVASVHLRDLMPSHYIEVKIPL